MRWGLRAGTKHRNVEVDEHGPNRLTSKLLPDVLWRPQRLSLVHGNWMALTIFFITVSAEQLGIIEHWYILSGFAWSQVVFDYHGLLLVQEYSCCLPTELYEDILRVSLDFAAKCNARTPCVYIIKPAAIAQPSLPEQQRHLRSSFWVNLVA